MNLLTLQRLKCDFYELKTWCLSGRASGTKSRTEPLASTALQCEDSWSVGELLMDSLLSTHTSTGLQPLYTLTHSHSCVTDTHTHTATISSPSSSVQTFYTSDTLSLLSAHINQSVQSKVILSFQPGYEASAAIVRLSGPRGFTHPPCYSPTSAGWTITDGDVRSVRCRRERVLHTATLI